MSAKNYRSYRNGNLAIFFLHVFNSKKIKELFAPTLNRIIANFRCESFATVVLNAKFLDWLLLRRTLKKPEVSDVFLRGGTQTWNSCRSQYFNDLCKPIEIYIYARKKQVILQQSAQNTANFLLRHARKKTMDFFTVQHGRQL